ncbi:MAG TPA: ABC transporter permease [Candidatus Atribacteria bacterium]|nr:ABC transporter permease [Candidatus Atribacteria bacterium]
MSVPENRLKKNIFSLQLNADDFLPADESEKQELVVMRKSVTFWRDGLKRLVSNNIAMISLVVIVFVILFAFVAPAFYPYSYSQQIRGSENLAPMEYSERELATIESGGRVFPHILGTDNLGRDYMLRVMMGTRISLIVGLVASIIVLIIGSVYGAISGYVGGKTDIIMMRIVDIIYSIPDILIIIILSVALKEPLKALFDRNDFLRSISILGPSLIGIFITFSLLYWVGMARFVRGQVLTIKEQEYVTAAKALGASSGRIIRKHILPNCIGTIIVVTTLQIPSAIFTESFLSFLGIGVSAPMPSLGSLASDAIGGIQSYPFRLFAPAIVICIVILSFNLLGDGLRDAFDPKLKK